VLGVGDVGLPDQGEKVGIGIQSIKSWSLVNVERTVNIASGGMYPE
jgi:hypothetical protein